MTISSVTGRFFCETPKSGTSGEHGPDKSMKPDNIEDICDLARQGLDKMKAPGSPDSCEEMEKIGRRYLERIAGISADRDTGLLIEIALNNRDYKFVDARIEAYQSVLASIGTIPCAPITTSIQSIVNSLLNDELNGEQNSEIRARAAMPFMEELERHVTDPGSKTIIQISNRKKPPYCFDAQTFLFSEALKDHTCSEGVPQDLFLANTALDMLEKQNNRKIRSDLMQAFLKEIAATSADPLNTEIAGAALRRSDEYCTGVNNIGYETALRAIVSSEPSEKNFQHMAEQILKNADDPEARTECTKPFLEELSKHTSDNTLKTLINTALLVERGTSAYPVYEALLRIINTVPVPSEEKALQSIVKDVLGSSLEHYDQFLCIQPFMKELEKYPSKSQSERLMKIGNERSYYATKLAFCQAALDEQEKPEKAFDDSFIANTALDMMKKQNKPEIRYEIMKTFLNEIIATSPDATDRQIASIALKIHDKNEDVTSNVGYEASLRAIASLQSSDKTFLHILQTIFKSTDDSKARATCAKPFMEELEKTVVEPMVKTLIRTGSIQRSEYYLKSSVCYQAALKELTNPSKTAPDIFLATIALDALANNNNDDACGQSDLMQGILSEIVNSSPDALNRQIAGAALRINDKYNTGMYKIGYETALRTIVSPKPPAAEETLLCIVNSILKNADYSEVQAICTKPFMEELEQYIKEPAVRMMIQTGNRLNPPYYFYTLLSCYQAALRELEHPSQISHSPEMFIVDTAMKAFRETSEPEIKRDVAKVFVTRLAEIAADECIKEICTGACSRAASKDDVEYEKAMSAIENYLQSKSEIKAVLEHLGNEKTEDIIICDDHINIGGITIDRRK